VEVGDRGDDEKICFEGKGGYIQETLEKKGFN
jgi:hypothetical protein